MKSDQKKIDIEQPLAEQQLSLAASLVKRLLEARLIPRHKRAATIEAALGVNYQLARRRLDGEVEWRLEELEKLAQHFGESLVDMVSTETLVPASIRIGDTLWGCRADIGDRAAATVKGELVARKIADDAGMRWLIAPADQALEGMLFEVRKVVLDRSKKVPKRIAVLDDEEDVAAVLVEYINSAGYEGTAFHNIRSLRDAISMMSFDGYIIDWLIHRVTSAELLGEIRGMNPNCPVFLLTAHNRDGGLNPELGQIASQLRLQYLQKPLASLELTSALASAFSH